MNRTDCTFLTRTVLAGVFGHIWIIYIRNWIERFFADIFFSKAVTEICKATLTLTRNQKVLRQLWHGSAHLPKWRESATWCTSYFSSLAFRDNSMSNRSSWKRVESEIVIVTVKSSLLIIRYACNNCLRNNRGFYYGHFWWSRRGINETAKNRSCRVGLVKTKWWHRDWALFTTFSKNIDLMKKVSHNRLSYKKFLRS